MEKFYEDELHGVAGYQEVEVNQPRPGGAHPEVPASPSPAGDIYLNIDIRLQLKRAGAAGRSPGAIVSDGNPTPAPSWPWESSPSYDPNLFVTGISSANYSALLNDPARPLGRNLHHPGHPCPASPSSP